MNYEIKNSIEEARYILILTHLNPDADTISSALALSNYLYENNKKHKVCNISVKDIPRVLDFLPKFDKITDQLPKFYDLIIYMDSSDQERVGIDIDKNIKIINIDHHASNSFFGDINIVDETKASTAEVLFDIFEANDMYISKNCAECLYVGIYDDSIAFTTPRVDQNTFKALNKLLCSGIKPNLIADKLLRRDSLARYRIMPKILETLQLHFEGRLATVYLDSVWLDQTGASIHECDDIVNMTLNIAVVDIVAYFRVVKGKVRVSLRSKGNIDVSALASKFNGGGHKNAAGLSIETVNIDEAKEQLLKAIQNYI